jgi:CRISPR-associated protein Csm4
VLLLIKLRFKSAIRIGGGDIVQGEEFRGILHSDTIFSAIINEWVRIYGSNTLFDLLSILNGDPPAFRISSAFPYYLNEFYLPTPIGIGELYMEKLRDVPFLELYDFLDLAEGKQDIIRKRKLKNPFDELIFNLTAPRVSIDRISVATNIFETSGWLIKQGGGLYFLIDLIDESLRSKLEICLKMLGESGIGGDRSVGYGHFDAEIQVADMTTGWSDLFKKREGNNIVYYTLSLCHPSNDEAREALTYQILSRKGWIFSRSSGKQMKRRACKMFAEGSVFKNPVKGQIADVTPSEFISEHNVYRYGLGMTVEIINLYD